MSQIWISSEAADWVKGQLDKRGRGEGIRLATKESGCTGYAYVLEFVDTPDEHDEVFEQHGVKMFVDPKSLVLLNGTVLEYKTEGLNSGLEFANPNVTAQCGCGESFTV